MARLTFGANRRAISGWSGRRRSCVCSLARVRSERANRLSRWRRRARLWASTHGTEQNVHNVTVALRRDGAAKGTSSTAVVIDQDWNWDTDGDEDQRGAARGIPLTAPPATMTREEEREALVAAASDMLADPELSPAEAATRSCEASQNQGEPRREHATRNGGATRELRFLRARMNKNDRDASDGHHPAVFRVHDTNAR